MSVCTSAYSGESRERRRLSLGGRVQGIGMRPFLSRLAREMGLSGWVANALEGVTIEVEGRPETLDEFARRLKQESPAQARIVSWDMRSIATVNDESGFQVRESLTAGAPQPFAPPDLGPCPDCTRELFDPADRRYRYPFISCCECGPRYSILRALPFDRERTSMADFPLCPACQAEYDSPLDRRFHAQTLCCPNCGPRLSWLTAGGHAHAEGDAALRMAVESLREGQIVAVQGIGGFQLLADARNGMAVAELRRRKRRPAKPFAILADDTMVRAACRASSTEWEWLHAPAAPIVLLDRLAEDRTICPQVAPNLPWLGVMLPASPLHLLILAEFGAPLVATSGNRSEEPLCIRPEEALTRLAGIADGFLVHDRPILRPLDDSLLRVAAGRPLMLRRARGFAPEPVELAISLPPLLALGGHLKNTVAVGAGTYAVLSQHLGDLDDALTRQQQHAAFHELPLLFGIFPRTVACDLHPDYASSRQAEDFGLPVQRVPHHYAHALAGMAEHHIEPPFLALSWDGLGLGDDGTLWGGEFLVVDHQGYRRFASFLPLPLPGGEQAVREPRRAALAALHVLHGEECMERAPQVLRKAFGSRELEVLIRLLNREFQVAACSSVGRLFDAVSALLGLCFINQFESQAAMFLEAAAQNFAGGEPAPYPFTLLPGDPQRIDWRPVLSVLLAEQTAGVPPGKLAARFHTTLADIALHIAALAGFPNVVLCGGCFQNRLLLERCVARLRQAGYGVHWPQRIPPNDGGLALGQLLGAARQLREP